MLDQIRRDIQARLDELLGEIEQLARRARRAQLERGRERSQRAHSAAGGCCW